MAPPTLPQHPPAPPPPGPGRPAGVRQTLRYARFDRNEVAIIFDGDEFVGLITRIDLINHLRRAR